MITVYFETNGHADKVATFEHDEDYNDCLPVLKLIAKERGYSKVTEVMT